MEMRRFSGWGKAHLAAGPRHATHREVSGQRDRRSRVKGHAARGPPAWRRVSRSKSYWYCGMAAHGGPPPPPPPQPPPPAPPAPLAWMARRCLSSASRPPPPDRRGRTNTPGRGGGMTWASRWWTPSGTTAGVPRSSVTLRKRGGPRMETRGDDVCVCWIAPVAEQEGRGGVLVGVHENSEISSTPAQLPEASNAGGPGGIGCTPEALPSKDTPVDSLDLKRVSWGLWEVLLAERHGGNHCEGLQRVSGHELVKYGWTPRTLGQTRVYAVS